jgi:hypothetical protein
MTALLALVPRAVWYIIGAAAVIAAVYSFGRYNGVQSGKVEQMKDTVEAVTNRSVIDAKTRSLPDYDKCIAIGGMPDTCAELRGME